MMSDLSRSLVDAAAEALRQGGFVDPDDDCVPTFYPADADRDTLGSIDVWTPVEDSARAAVAAVLETLAAGAESDYACFHPTRLRGLARAVLGEKEETDG